MSPNSVGTLSALANNMPAINMHVAVAALPHSFGFQLAAPLRKQLIQVPKYHIPSSRAISVRMDAPT
jgi:hypothetical protein